MLFVRYSFLLVLFLNGNFIMLFLSPAFDSGANGIVYGLPNEFKEHRFVIKNINIINTPYIPIVVAPIINSSLYHFIAFISSGSVNSRALIAVTASTIIITGDTIPALTAASPRIKAPTMDRAEVDTFGILRSLSLNISNDSIISRASKKAGNGTEFLWEAKLIKNSRGSIS